MTDEERERERRASATALLLARDRVERTLTRAADAAVASAAHEVRAGRRKSRAPVLLALIAAGRLMSAGLATAIEAGRKEARGLAARRLGAELRAVGAEASTGSPGLLAAAHLERMGVDAAEAAISADSLAAQWRGLATRVAMVAQREGEDVATAVSGTRVPLGPRIARTAATEAARAYNDEHEHRLRDLVASGDVDPEHLMREWCAMLDACSLCWPYDGERVGLLDSFSGGEPGTMHPRCACTAIVVSAA